MAGFGGPWSSLLRTLVLPQGATSGARIVLNGDTGLIEIYNTNGDLVATIGPDGNIAVFRLWDGSTIVGELASTTGPFDLAFRLAVAGDSDARFYVRADGGIFWGPGNVGADTNLYRSAADTLKTDDNLIVSLLLTVLGNAAVGGALNVTGNAVIGGDAIVTGDVAATTDLSVAARSIGRGIVATPTATALAGTATAAGSAVAVRDAVLGNHQVDLLAGRRYRVVLDGQKLGLSASTASLCNSSIYRLTGVGNPTVADTLVANASLRLTTGGGPGQESLYVANTFTVPASGTYTFAVFTINSLATAVTVTPVNSRELYVMDIGTP